MGRILAQIGGFDWRNLSDINAFLRWRDAKIGMLEQSLAQTPVLLNSLFAPESDALDTIRARCAATNMARYRVTRPVTGVEADCAALADFAGQLGLRAAEAHRSAGSTGIVALRSSDAPTQADFIPYSTRPMNWHTDGYYNPSEAPVQSFILHCHRPGASGGENQFADPELAYLRMREDDPALVKALMADDAMTIPENREKDGSVRPVSVGPVFFADRASGRLQMRYTARTRSIAWKDDTVTTAATEWLRDWFDRGDPLVLSIRMAAGEGIVSNNALHNRTGYQDGHGADGERVMLRARFHDRLTEE